MIKPVYVVELHGYRFHMEYINANLISVEGRAKTLTSAVAMRDVMLQNEFNLKCSAFTDGLHVSDEFEARKRFLLLQLHAYGIDIDSIRWID